MVGFQVSFGKMPAAVHRAGTIQPLTHLVERLRGLSLNSFLEIRELFQCNIVILSRSARWIERLFLPGHFLSPDPVSELAVHCSQFPVPDNFARIARD